MGVSRLMKVNYKKMLAERTASLQKWHRWFPLIPVCVGGHDFRCFEWVLRRGTMKHVYAQHPTRWIWEYRAVKNIPGGKWSFQLILPEKKK